MKSRGLAILRPCQSRTNEGHNYVRLGVHPSILRELLCVLLGRFLESNGAYVIFCSPGKSWNWVEADRARLVMENRRRADKNCEERHRCDVGTENTARSAVVP